MVSDTRRGHGDGERTKVGAWTVFAILAAVFVFSYFIRLSTGVLGPTLMEDLRLDVEQLGLLAGAFFYAFAFCQIPVGVALDSFSPKYVLLATLMPAIAGCALFALAGNFSTALWGRILIGVGMSSMLMGSLKIFGNWFRQDQFAFLSGMMLSLGNLGAFVSAAPLVFAVTMIGWRNCFWAFSLFLALSFLAILLFVKDEPGRGPASSTSAAASGGSSRGIGRLSSLGVVFLDRNFWMISLSAFIRYGSLICIQGFLGTLYLVQVMGYPAQKAGNILSMIAIGYLVGSPLMGRLSDSMFRSRKKVMVWGLFLYTLFMPLFLLDPDSDLLWYITFFALGFFASIGAVSFAHVKELFPKEVSGVALTANNLFNIGGVAVGQHVIGMLMARYPATVTGHSVEAYHAAFTVLFLSSLFGFLLYLFVEDSRIPSST
ncbi:MAG TPA: MFS transporter [Syntrophales bacterium]|nr:MFS transporter [Syntrophales bacterium]